MFLYRKLMPICLVSFKIYTKQIKNIINHHFQSIFYVKLVHFVKNNQFFWRYAYNITKISRKLDIFEFFLMLNCYLVLLTSYWICTKEEEDWRFFFFNLFYYIQNKTLICHQKLHRFCLYSCWNFKLFLIRY